MLIIVLIIFLLMFGVGYYSSRSLFAPYTLMAGGWVGIISLYYLLDHNLFSIHHQFPLAILLWGVGFFGSSYYIEAITKAYDEANTPRIINSQILKIYRWISVFTLPIVIGVTLYMAFTSDVENIFLYLRVMDVGQDETIDLPQFGILTYFIAMAYICYLIELQYKTSKNRKVIKILLILNILMAFITMARTVFFSLLISSLVILYMKKRIKMKTIVKSIIFFVLFCVGLQIVRSTTQDDGINISNFFSTYLVGSSVAFDYLEAIPGEGQFGGHVFRLIYAILNFFGADVPVEETIYEFVSIPELTNAYPVIYPFYLDFGYLGIFVFSLLYGAFYGYIYKKAVTGDNMFLLIYAVFSTFIFLQFMGEYIFTNASLFIQYVFYAILPFLIKKKIEFKYDRHINGNL